MTDEPARVARIWRELDGESLDDVLEDERRGQDSASTTPPMPLRSPGGTEG
ncbi:MULTISPECIES: hypothetical protein [unclassified Kribbella]|uniref:hypothetical protein n=1 Tax=unclassified Kribbella TaxID=2644121 RepID=UPI003016B51B